MKHILPAQIRRHGHVPPRPRPELLQRLARLVRRDAHVRDGLHHHAGHVQVRAVLHRPLHHRVHRDALHGGDVAERHGAVEEPEHVGAAGLAGGAVLVVGGAVVPGAEAGGFGWRAVAGREVQVGEG